MIYTSLFSPNPLAFTFSYPFKGEGLKKKVGNWRHREIKCMYVYVWDCVGESSEKKRTK